LLKRQRPTKASTSSAREMSAPPSKRVGILPRGRMIPMSKRMLNPKVRQILMQGLLVVVFLAAVGLAALVTRHVRMSMRVELGEMRTIGRLVVRMPAKWLSSPAVVEKGAGVE